IHGTGETTTRSPPRTTGMPKASPRTPSKSGPTESTWRYDTPACRSPRAHTRALLHMMSPDAVLCLSESGSDRLHFFKNREVACWDVARETLVAGYPRDIDECWPGLLGRFPG